MRCTDCEFAKETIPAQLHYVYCKKYEVEVSVVTEFDQCQYKESEEYKIKQLITEFCNIEKNHIVCVDYDSMCCYVGNKLNIPSAIKSITLYRDFRNKVDEILKQTLKPYTVAKLQNFTEGEYDVLILKGEGEE